MTRTNWIRSSENAQINSVSYFRKEVDTKKEPISVQILTSAHNHLKFYFNGSIVTGYVSPAAASIPENVYYLSYTLEGAELAKLLCSDKTKLCFAAAVQYLGDSGTNYVNASPAFWAEINIVFSDGSKLAVLSDTSWRALAETPYKNGTPSLNKRKTGAQIDYDARKMPDALSWTRYGYDERSYQDGAWTYAVAADKETASWKMRPQSIPEGDVHKAITPTPIGRQENGWQVFDAGQLVSGWVRIRASAPTGTRICIRYSEYLEGDTVSYAVGSLNQKSENYCDYYTFSGNGIETFASDFNYKAFRYFEVVGLTETLDATSLSVEWASTAITQSASFSSSDPFLTKLYQACINTQINGIQGMPVDCPHREQAQYLADSQLQYALLSYGFEEYSELCRKTLLDFATSQRESGRFSFTAPTAGYAKTTSIPEWDLRYTRILYGYYSRTPSPDDLAQFYEAACKNVSLYWSKRNENGLLEDEVGAWNISDHPMIKHVPDDPGAGVELTVCNLLLYDSVNLLSQIAKGLEKEDEAAEWAKKAEVLKDAINQRLLNLNTGLYYQHSDTTKTNTGVTALAINVGVATPYYLEKQMKALSQVSTFDTSIVLTYELFYAVMAHGSAEQKNSVYQRMVNHWGPMVEKGHGTVWEGFLDQSSHSHAWSAYPAYFMLKDFLGVESMSAKSGETVTLTPFLPDGVDSIEGEISLPVLDRSLSVSISRKVGYTLTVESEGVQIDLAVPRVSGQNTTVLANGVKVFEGGKGMEGALEEVVYLREDEEYVYFHVSVDQAYCFESRSTEETDEFSVTIVNQEGGSVLSKCDGKAFEGSVLCNGKNKIELTATASEGYAFVGWRGSMGSAEQSLALTPTSETVLYPIFEKREGKVIHIEKEDPSSEKEDEVPTSSQSTNPATTAMLSAKSPLPFLLLIPLILLVPAGIVLVRKKTKKK